MNRSSVIASLLLVPTMLLVSGCKPSVEDQIVGTWKVTSATLSPEVDKGLMAGQLKSALNSATLSFSKEPKTFSLNMAGAPMEGDYTISGNTITLNTTKVGGQTLDQVKQLMKTMKQDAVADSLGKPWPFTLSEDGKTLSSTAEGGFAATTLSKQEEAK